MHRLSGLIWCLALAACPAPEVPDAGSFDSGLPDAGVDAGDGAKVDAGADAGSDAGPIDAGPDLRCPLPNGASADGGLVRIVAANLSSGSQQSWNPGEGKRILQGLKPDVALMQEWNIGSNTDTDRRAFVDSTFGTGFCFHIQSGGVIPNGVISRWPILDAGQWVDPQVGNRAFAWAQIDVPGPRDLWAVSIHLLTTGSMRNAEAQALVMNINQFIPAADLLVVGGDLNSSNRTEPAITTLSQVVRTLGPHPVDAFNNGNTNAGRSQPYDWVMADEDLYALQVPVVVGAATFDAGLVFDSRIFSPLSAVAPIQPLDSAEQYMQHMAVVKDFLLP